MNDFNNEHYELLRDKMCEITDFVYKEEIFPGILLAVLTVTMGKIINTYPGDDLEELLKHHLAMITKIALGQSIEGEKNE